MCVIVDSEEAHYYSWQDTVLVTGLAAKYAGLAYSLLVQLFWFTYNRED